MHNQPAQFEHRIKIDAAGKTTAFKIDLKFIAEVNPVHEKSETIKTEAQGGHGSYDVLVISVIPALVFSHSDGSSKLFCSICLFIHISYFTLFELLAAFETNSLKAFLITIIIAP